MLPTALSEHQVQLDIGKLSAELTEMREDTNLILCIEINCGVCLWVPIRGGGGT